MSVSLCANGVSSKLPDRLPHLPATVTATHGGEIKEGQEMMSGGRLCAFKSALNDADRKASTFLVRWSQAGFSFPKESKGEGEKKKKSKNQTSPEQHRLISNSYLAF